MYRTVMHNSIGTFRHLAILFVKYSGIMAILRARTAIMPLLRIITGQFKIYAVLCICNMGWRCTAALEK